MAWDDEDEAYQKGRAAGKAPKASGGKKEALLVQTSRLPNQLGFVPDSFDRESIRRAMVIGKPAKQPEAAPFGPFLHVIGGAGGKTGSSPLQEGAGSSTRGHSTRLPARPP